MQSVSLYKQATAVHVVSDVNINDAVSLLALQDEEINQQSQLAEKLKQQMLDQEEVSNGRPGCRVNTFMNGPAISGFHF